MKPYPSAEINRQFQNYFGKSIKSYWCIYTGFDVVKFDEEIVQPPDGTSTADHVKAVYGEEALKLCKKLLAM